MPSLSVTLATWLALVALLALLASISHTGRSVRVSWVSESIVAETRRTIEDVLPPPGAVAEPGRVALDAPGVAPSPVRVALGDASEDRRPTDAGHRVDSVDGGWVQQIGAEALVAPLEPGSRLRLHVAVGTYVAAGAPLATVRPAPADPGGVDDAVRGAIRLGRERTLQQDITFGLTVLEDIALRALSPGVNDPNTARAVIPQLGVLLVEILERRLPPARAVVDGVELQAAAEPSHGDYLEAATGQLRRATEDHPPVRLTLVRTLVVAGDELHPRGRAEGDGVAALVDSLSRLSPAADDGEPATGAIRDILDATTWRPRAGR